MGEGGGGDVWEGFRLSSKNSPKSWFPSTIMSNVKFFKLFIPPEVNRGKTGKI